MANNYYAFEDSFGIRSTQEGTLKPVYVVLVGENYTELNEAAGGAILSTSTSWTVASWTGFTAKPGTPILIYDEEYRWELVTHLTYTEDSPAGFDTMSNITRGQFGTLAQGHNHRSRIMSVRFAAISGDLTTTLPTVVPLVSITGTTSEVFVQDGRNSVQPVGIQIADHSGIVTQRQSDAWEMLGKRAVVLGGYEGMPLSAFRLLYSGVITENSYRAGIYALSIDPGMNRLQQSLYGFLEDQGQGAPGGKLLLNVSATNSQTFIDLNADAPHDQPMTPSTASMYFRITDATTGDIEIVRLQQRNVSIEKRYTIIRGELGTNAIALAKNSAVQQFFYWVGKNPVDILLGLLMTGQKGRLDAVTYAIPVDTYGSLVTSTDPLGLRWDVPDIDIPSFEAFRDDWVPSWKWEIYFTGRTDMRRFIEEHFLKPMNATLDIDVYGKLRLVGHNPPLGDSNVKVLTDDDITEPVNWVQSLGALVNVTSVNWEYDPWSKTYGETVEAINLQSQSDYDQEGRQDINAIGITSNYAGRRVAERIANLKNRMWYRAFPMADISVRFTSAANLQPGDVVRLTLSKDPEPRLGKLGFDNLVSITSRRVNWMTGEIVLGVITTSNYAVKGRLGRISPSSVTADYDAATDAQHDDYVWLSNPFIQQDPPIVNENLMPGGDQGYVIA